MDSKKVKGQEKNDNSEEIFYYAKSLQAEKRRDLTLSNQKNSSLNIIEYMPKLLL